MVSTANNRNTPATPGNGGINQAIEVAVENNRVVPRRFGNNQVLPSNAEKIEVFHSDNGIVPANDENIQDSPSDPGNNGFFPANDGNIRDSPSDPGNNGIFPANDGNNRISPSDPGNNGIFPANNGNNQVIPVENNIPPLDVGNMGFFPANADDADDDPFIVLGANNDLAMLNLPAPEFELPDPDLPGIGPGFVYLHHWAYDNHDQ